MAVQKLETLNPSTSLSANRMMRALMTNKKTPKVIMVIGKVRITKKGFTSKLRIDKTTATIIAPT